MHLECLSPDAAADEALHLKTIGRIVPEPDGLQHDHFVALLGPHIYSRRVVLNLADSEFISSSGIGWLLQTHKRFERAGGKLVLRDVPKEIEQVLRVMRLQSVLNFN